VVIVEIVTWHHIRKKSWIHICPSKLMNPGAVIRKREVENLCLLIKVTSMLFIRTFQIEKL